MNLGTFFLTKKHWLLIHMCVLIMTWPLNIAIFFFQLCQLNFEYISDKKQLFSKNTFLFKIPILKCAIEYMSMKILFSNSYALHPSFNYNRRNFSQEVCWLAPHQTAALNKLLWKFLQVVQRNIWNQPTACDSSSLRGIHL